MYYTIVLVADTKKKRILEFMFDDARKFLPPEEALKAIRSDPHSRLRLFVLTFIKVIYAIDSELDADLASIFTQEIAHASR